MTGENYSYQLSNNEEKKKKININNRINQSQADSKCTFVFYK